MTPACIALRRAPRTATVLEPGLDRPGGIPAENATGVGEDDLADLGVEVGLHPQPAADHQRGPRVGLVELGHRLVRDLPLDLLEDHLEQGFFVGEVVIKGALGHPGPGHDLQRGGPVAPVAEQLPGRRQQRHRVASPWAAFFPLTSIP